MTARFYFYQSGFDPTYERSSVGLITMGLSIQAALEEGACEYDLLHGEGSIQIRTGAARAGARPDRDVSSGGIGAALP